MNREEMIACSKCQCIEDTSGKSIKRHKVTEPCVDCGVKNGYHWANCDQEKCPICGLQMMGCDCWTTYLETKTIKVKPKCENTDDWF